MLQLLLSITWRAGTRTNSLPNSTSSSTAAYYYWMIFNVIEPSLPDKERAVDDIDGRIPECSFGTHQPKK